MCNCENNACIDVFLTPCADTVTLPIQATETGTWRMVYDFNGTVIRTDISVTNGNNIAIPASVLNEDYTHVVRFYKTDLTIFNDTCYQLNIMATVFTNPSATASVPAHINVIWAATGTTLTDARLEGRNVTQIDYNGISYNEDLSVSGTTLAAGISIEANTKVTIHLA